MHFFFIKEQFQHYPKTTKTTKLSWPGPDPRIEASIMTYLSTFAPNDFLNVPDWQWYEGGFNLCAKSVNTETIWLMLSLPWGMFDGFS